MMPTPLQKLGTKEFKEGLDLVIAIVNAGGKTLEDGRVTFTDLPAWFPVSTKVSAAVENFQAIWPEIKDLDAAEAEDIHQYVKDRLDLPQDQIEHWLELAVGVLVRLVELFSMQKAARIAAKAASVVVEAEVVVKEAGETVAPVVEEVKEVVEEAKETLVEKVTDVVEQVAQKAEEAFTKVTGKGKGKKK